MAKRKDNSKPAVDKGQPNNGLWSRFDLRVFVPSAVIAVIFVVWCFLAQDSLANITQSLLHFLLGVLGWVYVLGTVGTIGLCVYLFFCPYRHVRLGKDDERPEFSTFSWISMIFAAGMGIGLLFYGVSEPISHFVNPPPGTAEPQTREAAQVALLYTYLHWGITGWTVYAVFGLALAYFSYRYDGRNLVSTACRPILGRWVDGPIGHGLDVIAVIATLFGLIPTLGMGALQVNSALNFVWGIPTTGTVQMIFIAVTTALFVISATTGVGKGIELLANVSMLIAVALLLYVLFLGPTSFILGSFVQTIGDYIYRLWPLMFRTGEFYQSEWIQNWTLYYWAWWFAWAPYVGTFIARISRGRTIREYVLGVTLMPAVVNIVSFAVFGGAAIKFALERDVGLVEAVQQSQASALFALLQQFPLFNIVTIIVMVLLVLWFVSGADAGAVVMGMLSAHGSSHPPRLLTAFWGVISGVVAAALLLAGGLTALQRAMVVMSAPFIIVMLILTLGTLKQLRHESRYKKPRGKSQPGSEEPQPGSDKLG